VAEMPRYMKREQEQIDADFALVREGLKAMRGWLPEPQNKSASQLRDAQIVNVRKAHREAVEALERIAYRIGATAGPGEDS
jgi:hypothetical protein